MTTATAQANPNIAFIKCSTAILPGDYGEVCHTTCDAFILKNEDLKD